MKRLFKNLLVFYDFYSEKKLLFLVFIFLLLSSTLVLSLPPFFIKIFIDGIAGGNLSELANILLIYMVVRLFGLGLDTLTHLLADVHLIDSAAKVRTQVFRHLQDLDFAFHTSRSTGSLISIMKRGDGAFFTLQYTLHFRIVRVFISFLMMFYIYTSLNPRIGMLVAVSFLLALLISKIVVSYNIKTRKDFNDSEDRVSSIITDNIINFETVKIFAKEQWEIRRLSTAFADWKKRLWSYSNSFRILDISIGMLIDLSIGFILFLSIFKTGYTPLTPGEFGLVIGFIGYFYPNLGELVWGFRDVAKNYADLDKYFGILDYEIAVKDPEKSEKIRNFKGEIEFKNVSFSYKDGKKNALKLLNLKVRAGQSVALVGRSGSGKTTIIKLLLRFFDVNKGNIQIDGVAITNMTKSYLRSLIGVVPQEPILFNNTIGYNIGYAKENVTQQEIMAAAKIANLDTFINTLPKKYSTNVGERGIKLSGGQKQRLAIARMILSNPYIIIFDEATSQLDSENEKLIQEAFWKVAKNKSTIIIAHRLSTAMRADKIIVLEEGRIIEAGTHLELVNNCRSLYKYFWDLQTNHQPVEIN